MSIPEGCPCEAVRDLTELVREHDKRLHDGNTTFALIQQDLGYIKARLDEKKKFNSGVFSAIVQSACAILLAYVAAKLGLG